MASLQCPKPANDTSQQKCDSNGNNHHSSGLGQKAAEVASWITGKQPTTDQAHCPSVAQAQNDPHHATAKTATHSSSHTQGTSGGQCGLTKPTGHKGTSGGVTAGYDGKTKKKGGHKKKKDKSSLLQKIKDACSDSSSSSSSDSESDSEGCHERKN